MKKRRKWVRTMLCAAAISLFAFSFLQLFRHVREEKISSDYNRALVQRAVNTVPETDGKAPETDPAPIGDHTDMPPDLPWDKPERKTGEAPPLCVDFAVLLKENSDIVGWLYCPDSPINYPVVQADDNAYYLRRLISGEWNSAGSLFMDYRNDLSAKDWNTVIFGHNMKNDSMFGTLPRYSSQEYYEDHPVMYFLTPETNYRIDLLSGFVTPSDSSLYQIYLSGSECETVISDILARSDFASQAVPEEGDRLLTLSTCSYEYDTARYVVIGKMTELTEQDTNRQEATE